MSEPKTRPTTPFEAETASSIRRAVALPEVIDARYRVIERLGVGSQGVVLRAEDLFLQRPVAIKLVDGHEKLVVERFVKEAQALARVRHENVVQVYAFGPLRNSHYLAMELVVGETLEMLIHQHYRVAKAPVPLDRALAILRAVALGLEAVHACQLIHRDVKPGNVIIETGTDRPVLIDFGLARGRARSTPEMSVSGTPWYMAPEQAKDPDGTWVSSKSDLYALGCTAFELLTGELPFEGDDIYEVLQAHIHDPPRALSSLRPELASLDSVIARALAKEPSDRHASASEMLAALEGAFARIGAPSSCALVLAADPSLRRSLVRCAAQSLKKHGIELPCETAASAQEAAAFLPTSECDLFVIDEESAGGRLGELIALLRQVRPNAEVVIVSRDLPATQRSLAPLPVRHLVPKPVNVHVFAAVVDRTELVRNTR